MQIIVTMPAYNEQDTIGKVINDIHASLKNRYKYKILVVDDGSTDRTASIAKSAGAVVYSHPRNYGLAEAFKSEIKKALELKADIIVHTDADGQYLAKEIPKLIAEVHNGNDLVLGSRFAGRIEGMPLIKRMGNIAFSRVISNIIGMKISDAQTGFRAFTSEVAQKIQIISDHTYTQEQVIKASRQKFRIKETPIYFAKRKDKSRLISNPFSYAARAWISIIRIYRDYKPLKFFGVIGAVVFAFGFVLGLYLTRIQLFGEGINRHLPLTMLDILVLSIGLQIIIFGFMADMAKK